MVGTAYRVLFQRHEQIISPLQFGSEQQRLIDGHGLQALVVEIDLVELPGCQPAGAAAPTGAAFGGVERALIDAGTERAENIIKATAIADPGVVQPAAEIFRHLLKEGPVQPP